jgi:hypothetical protein
MVSDKRVTCSSPPPLLLFSGDVPPFSDQPKVRRPDDEGEFAEYTKKHPTVKPFDWQLPKKD